MKKLVSIIMSIVMLFSVVSAVNITALADDYTYTYGDWVYGYYKDDTIGIAYYNGSATSVSIPLTIKGTKVTGIESQAFDNCQGLRDVYIPNTIEWISPTAFKPNKNLNQINVDNSNCLLYFSQWCIIQQG